VPVIPSADELSAIVSTLRTAGCVFAEDEAQLLAAAAGSPAELGVLVARRAGGLPLEQVVGWAEFCGLRIAVSSGVFVPRRRSEFLVRRAAALRPARGGPRDSPPPVVLDMCCGSGAVGVALAAALGGAQLHAADIDPAAVACARLNVGAAGEVYAGDLYEPLPNVLRGRVDILVANAPYVPTSQIRLMPAEARLHEPRVALDGGEDGVGIQRRVAAGAPQWLAPGGHLLIETSERQAELTAQAMTDAGLAPEVAGSGEWSATVVIGRQPG
jgi:release factor glutamine methyltransferase